MELAGRKIYRGTLSGEEREALQAIQRGGGAAERRLRAHILLLADEDRAGGGLTDAAIASVLKVGWDGGARSPAMRDGGGRGGG